MVVAMLVGLIAKLTLNDQTNSQWRVIYWVEAVALGSFGVAWIVAGRYIGFLVDKDEALHLFSNDTSQM